MNNNVYRYVYFDTTLNNTFRSKLWNHAYHVLPQYPLGTTPSTIYQVDLFGLCGMYNLVSDNSSGNIPPPPCHFYISCGCVVCSGMIAAVNLPLTFLYYSLEDPSPSHPAPWLNIYYIESVQSVCR